MLKKYLLSLAAFAIAAGSIFVSPAAYANIEDLTVDTGCSELPSYTGIMEVDKGSYDIYVRLSKRGEKAEVNSYVSRYEVSYGECTQLQTVVGSGDSWTKVGQFDANDPSQYVFELSSNYLDKLPDANRPSVMVVPTENAPCVPAIECSVKVEGKDGIVRPTGTLLNQDSLHVLKVVDPKRDTVTRVRYYVDDRLVYETKQFKKFDSRYVAFREQKLKYVIDYKSGQQVIIEEPSDDTHLDTFSNFLFRLTQTYPLALTVLIVIAGILMVASLFMFIIRLLQKRYNDRLRYGFVQQRTPLMSIAAYTIDNNKVFRTIKYISLAGVMIGIVLVSILVADRYIVQIITVDGKSMRTTFYTGDNVLVNRLPKTFADFNNREFVPERGQVVIVKGIFGTTNISPDDTSDLRLIKRVIGLPGERVLIRDGKITIYNKEHPDGFVPDDRGEWRKRMTPVPKTESIDIQLKDGELFVIGDNRPESIDSRFSGPISTKAVIGTVWLKIWPFSR